MALAALTALAVPPGAQAQVAVSEDFTGTSTSNPWYFFNGACLTAGTAAGAEPSGGAGGQMPGCTALRNTYYNESLVGGQNGVAGGAQTLPDPAAQGALRFTNGNPGGLPQQGPTVPPPPFHPRPGGQCP